MGQETDDQGRFTSPDTKSPRRDYYTATNHGQRRRARAMLQMLAGGHVEGHGWRMEFLRQLARARADGLLTAGQVKDQLPADLLLAVEALAEELRSGKHVMPLVVLGIDWDFGNDRQQPRASDQEPAETYTWPWWAVLALVALGFVLGALVFH